MKNVKALPLSISLQIRNDNLSAVEPLPIASSIQSLMFSADAKPQDSASSIIISLKILDKFLKYIGFGEQNEAEEMIKTDRNLLLESGNLTDCSKRNFKKITAFQYALWALDFHMWQMILKYLAPEEAIKQVAGLKNGAWVKIYGIKVDWQNLIDALQNHIDNYRTRSSKQCLTYWCQQVGGAQLLLPAHVINEYSYPSRPLYPCPIYGNEESPLPRTGVEKWFTRDNHKLGIDYAWFREGKDLTRDYTGCACDSEPLRMMRAVYQYSDLYAVTYLINCRQEQYSKLVSKLTREVQAEETSLSKIIKCNIL